MKQINLTKNGQVFKCSKCNRIHIEFKNLNFNFSEKQFAHFASYLSEINPDEREKDNAHLIYKRKIIIPIGNKQVNIMLNKAELIELKQLFSNIFPESEIKPFENIKVMDFKFTQFYN